MFCLRASWEKASDSLKVPKRPFEVNWTLTSFPSYETKK